jgi:hypothetical protein
VVPLHVSAFTLEDHPKFGRSLMVNGKLIDPTVLRFNHKKHLDPSVLTGDQRQCIWCHDPSPATGVSMSFESGKNAFGMPGGDSGPPHPLDDSTSHHRSLTQVSYSRNCVVCHKLGTLPGSDLEIPHASMSEVRKVILTYISDRTSPWQKMAPDKLGAKEKPLNERFISKLNVPGDYSDEADAVEKAVKANPIFGTEMGDPTCKLPTDLAMKLSEAAGKLPSNIVAKTDRDRVMADIAATSQPSEHLRPLIIARLKEQVCKGLTGAAKQKMADQVDAVMARYDQETPDPRLVEAYVAFANDGGANCVLCHDTEGSAADIPPEWAILPTQKPVAAAATMPATVFRIKPTGIPAGPRRWYVNSEFNHDAHRSMNCVECHTAALTSEATSDVLSPNIQWQGLRFKPDGSGEMEPAARSCVECHHTDTAESPGAAANCTECHVYHDRSHENVPKSTPKDVLDGKIAVPAAGQVSSVSP